MNNEDAVSTIGDFKNKRILVIGDIILDKYLEGIVERISPEAPVPIIKIESEDYKLGGAANVAANITSLGGFSTLLGFIGNDVDGKKMIDLAERAKIRFIPSYGKITTIKTRITSEKNQLLRMDLEEIDEKFFDETILKREIELHDLIIVSDYAKGVVTKILMEILKKSGKKIIVDPRPKNKMLYLGVFLITPNKRESIKMSGCTDEHLAGIKLKEELKANIIMTRGKEGMSIFNDGIKDIPTYAKEVYDITGAGDTVIAVLGLAIACGKSLEEAAFLANHAAGIVVSKHGTEKVYPYELFKKINGNTDKVKNFDEIKTIIEVQKANGKKIVWTNGCFDLIHHGHTEYLKEAKKLGHCLIVGLNSDESIKKIKGPKRPIQSEYARSKILSSLESVDYVLIFNEENVSKYISELKPDIFVKGEDYNLTSMNLDEKNALESYNGKAVFMPFIVGASTTNLINKIKDL